MKARRQISQSGAVRLMSDILSDQEDQITKLLTLFVKHFCNCTHAKIDPLDVEHHAPECGYRREIQ